MNPLLQQFIQEARDLLQDISTHLLALEDQPDSSALMTELFRQVHTLKGNSGLFDFPEMTRVLHAGEDLMDAVREGRVRYSRTLADPLLDAMDFVAMLIDRIEPGGSYDAGYAAAAEGFARNLRALLPEPTVQPEQFAETVRPDPVAIVLPALTGVPEAARMAAWRAAESGKPLFMLGYRPDDDCFYRGEDPFHQARQVPELLWGTAVARQAWPPLAELDCYRCQVDFYLLTSASRTALQEHFRYTPEQIRLEPVEPLSLIVPTGHLNGGPVYRDFVAEALELLDAQDREGLELLIRTLLDLSSPDLWLASDLRWLLVVLETRPEEDALLRRLIEALNSLTGPDLSDLSASASLAAVAALPEAAPPSGSIERGQVESVLATQLEILALPDQGAWLEGRIKSVAVTVKACLGSLGEPAAELDAALAASLTSRSAQPLRHWLHARLQGGEAPGVEPPPVQAAPVCEPVAAAQPVPGEAMPEGTRRDTEDTRPSHGRDDLQPGKILKVDQARIDRLMNLIGEMVVAKNGLPYLANRAENQYGVRELAREIKAQYAVINRIAEEMQDAIMQVRMMPVSFIFKRFPRLVRDLARKLGKEVELALEGEDTEADKNIIESLADPLIHIVRNSMDHGLETPAARQAAGKPVTGHLLIRALQESDRVLIEISDDGQGIDPALIKRKAYGKGLIDEAQLERISDQEAINLIFTPGFSTADAVTDLSGRGVGMDVVRNAIDRVGGTIELASHPGRGTTLRLSLPLSMAVTHVMIIESNRQIFGVPMDLIVETVRLPQTAIHTIKQRKTTVLRDQLIPLLALNELLAMDAAPLANADGELATLVVRVGNEPVGLLVDEFHEVVDVILKPLPGELARLGCYAGSALLGDGSVLMILNPRELL